MTNKAESHEYFLWLCSRIRIPEKKNYWKLLELIHMKEFVWTVGNDDNRVQDGRDLKHLYLSQKHHHRGIRIGETERSFDEPVSVLEVLIALSDRLGFLIDIDASACAWMLIENLELDKHDKADEINDILDNLIWRTYRHNGSGGFFPLRHPTKDQTSVEIWYQMTEWIEENYNPHDM